MTLIFSSFQPITQDYDEFIEARLYIIIKIENDSAWIMFEAGKVLYVLINDAYFN